MMKIVEFDENSGESPFYAPAFYFQDLASS
jgi:hypothetical protein